MGLGMPRTSAGSVRNGLTVEQAAQTTWLLCSPATHQQLTERLGWSQADDAAWLHATLETVLLRPSAD